MSSAGSRAPDAAASADTRLLMPPRGATRPTPDVAGHRLLRRLLAHLPRRMPTLMVSIIHRLRFPPISNFLMSFERKRQSPVSLNYAQLYAA